MPKYGRYVKAENWPIDLVLDAQGRIIGLRSQNSGDETQFALNNDPVPQGASKVLSAVDDGATLDCTATGLDFTLPAGLDNFGCAIIPNGTTRVIAAAGVTVNGVVAGTLTFTGAVGAIVATSVPNSYKVVGV